MTGSAAYGQIVPIIAKSLPILKKGIVLTAAVCGIDWLLPIIFIRYLRLAAKSRESYTAYPLIFLTVLMNHADCGIAEHWFISADNGFSVAACIQFSGPAS
ncbi:MAG: hypothetical protein QMB71_06055 [Tolumonas sp.]